MNPSPPELDKHVSTDFMTVPISPKPWMHRVRDSLRSPSLQRLATAIPALDVELEVRIACIQTAIGSVFPYCWNVQAGKLLELAKQAERNQQENQGWRYLKAVDRLMYHSYDQKELRMKAQAIAEQAGSKEKGLSSWRKESISKLLKGLKDTNCQNEPKLLVAEDVIEAKRLLDEHDDNLYLRIAILKTRLVVLVIISVVWLILWFTTVSPIDFNSMSPALSEASIGFWWSVVLAGVLGTLVSAFTSAIGTDPKSSRIPAEISTLTLTFARIAVGALSAIIIALFLASGALTSIGSSYSFTLVAAVVSGFSDRLLLNAISGFMR